MKYPPTELVLNANNQVYHLGISKSDISEKIILVGDQDRVDLVASYFDSIEHRSRHREFACKTGTYQGKRITALSTGIGTDNIDITINELDAVFNIDVMNRTDAKPTTAMQLVRIGTCGILQSDIPVHSYVLSNHALGLDNVAHYYNIPFTSEEKELTAQMHAQLKLPALIHPYVSEASAALNAKLSSERTVSGITVTSSGFYGPQGRQLRLSNKTSELNDSMTNFRFKQHRIVNFEMESSALFALGKALGHSCTTICLGIANRPNHEFSGDYQEKMLQLIKYVLDRI